MYIFSYILNPHDPNDYTIEQKEFCELKGYFIIIEKLKKLSFKFFIKRWRVKHL